MPAKSEKVPCFWCCSARSGLYGASVGMLNLHCLAIVFDLDETLIVANTMKSFEDRIEMLTRRMDIEEDPVRIAGMSAEIKRYIEDKEPLKEFIDTYIVTDNGKIVRTQKEVQPVSGGQERVFRPVIRLPDRNAILTRINPEIRDTSVFVKLKPAWEELRSYLTAKGRKRFEVYVCTMAERDYALEMWRLLDPEGNLISSQQLSERVNCVKSEFFWLNHLLHPARWWRGSPGWSMVVACRACCYSPCPMSFSLWRRRQLVKLPRAPYGTHFGVLCVWLQSGVLIGQCRILGPDETPGFFAMSPNSIGSCHSSMNIVGTALDPIVSQGPGDITMLIVR